MISVIIPSLPGGSVEKTTNSLKKTSYPKSKIEVLIVYGRNPSRQRNLGVKKSKGDIVFFFDDDVDPVRDIFEKSIRHYKNNTVSVVGGPAVTPQSDSFLQHCFGYVLESFFGAASLRSKFTKRGSVKEATERDMILCNMSVRKKVFNDVGGFDQRLYPNEENEFLSRVKLHNHKIVYDPSITVCKSQRKNLKKFSRQLFNYGRGRSEHLLIRPSSFSPLFLVPTAFFLYLLSLPFFLNFLHILPLIAYMAVAMGSSITVSIKTGDLRVIPVLPFLYFLVHISYGSGFIYGLFRRFLKKKKEVKIEIKRVKI